jgi:DNA polymerase delta subunit 2
MLPDCFLPPQRVTNPYECSVEGVHILGTSGQNVSDMMRYFDNPEGPLGAMRTSLQCSHMAPTAPDTLEVMPSEVDPFLLEQCPHVYFAGCQVEFGRIVVSKKEYQLS